MEQVQLEAVMRKKEESGKKFASKLRKEGFIPAVVYKGGQKTIEVAVGSKELLRILHAAGGGNVIIDLKIHGEPRTAKPRTVIVKEIQQHPYKDNIMHVDFHQIALDEALKVKVPIETKGEPLGVARDAGVLERIMWEVEVECLPAQLPQKIEIDVTGLEVGHSKLVKDLIAPAGVRILADPQQIVVSVAAKKAVEEAVAAPAAGVEEPEVIREKKPSEEEAAADEAAEQPAAEKKPKEEKK